MPTLLDIRETANRTSQPPEEHRSGAQSPLQMTVLWAVLIFAAINVFLWNADKDKQSRDVLTGTGSVDLVVGGFKSLSKPPGVVLIGSSLVMYPFWTMDRDRYGAEIPDIFHHHQSLVLKKRLKDAGFANDEVYNFSVFGEMVSDAYIYVDEFLKDNKKPEFVVYGIAPRDFHDSDLPGPMSTNTFKRLVGLENLARFADLYLPGFQDKIDFVMSHVCFFYSKRWRLQHEFEKAIDKAYTAVGARKAPSSQVKPEGAQQNGFMLAGDKDDRWNNSVKEYTRRYKNIGDRDLSVQTGFLTRLLDVCQSRGIKVVVLNMPLSNDNRSLLPPGFYNQFRQKVASLSQRPGVRFIDLAANVAEFGAGDYWDTCHLEHGGGYKMLNHLLPAMEELRAAGR